MSVLCGCWKWLPKELMEVMTMTVVITRLFSFGLSLIKGTSALEVKVKVKVKVKFCCWW